MTTTSTTRPGPGRPPAASREDVLDAAMRRYLRGSRIDVQAIAAELASAARPSTAGSGRARS